MGAITRILFSLESSGDLETYLGEQFVEVVGDLLVKPV